MAAAADLGRIDGFDISLDTDIRETLGVRVSGQDASLLANVNGDDGDRAFAPGLMSARTDISSELVVSRGHLGFDISADGWYDPVYYGRTANDSPYTFNPDSVPNDSFPADVRRLMGGYVELGNAYVRDSFAIGETAVSVRLGRQTLLWGESLFFPQNGIAAGQAPVDDIKALSQPLAEAKELFLPVTQAVIRVQLGPDLALEAYDQFEWRHDRFPGVSSYFSTTDLLDAGGERLLLGDYRYLRRGPDATPSGVGQFGVALRGTGAGLDFGVYAMRYNAKAPELVLPTAGTYSLVYPTGIDVLGVSASSYAGDANLAGEISVRHGMPLVSRFPQAGLVQSATGGTGIGYALALPAPAPAPSGTAYATGDTLHAQASIIGALPPGRFWQGAGLAGEIAANELLSVTGGRAALAPGRHFAVSAQGVFTPQYFQVLPNLDVTLSMGLGYTIAGHSAVDGSQNAGAGNVTIGASGVYRAVWQAGAAFTHFIGGAGQQALADRDFLSVSVSRSF